jgi:hypothetical protein
VKKARKILGYSALICGGASLIVGMSPLFPVFAEAFLVSGGFFALGIGALLGPELRLLFRHLVRAAPAETPAPIDPLLPVRILSLAKGREGILTVSEVAMALNISLEQAEEGLKVCVRKGNAQADFDIARGFTLYRFPEFLPPRGQDLLQ